MAICLLTSLDARGFATQLWPPRQDIAWTVLGWGGPFLSLKLMDYMVLPKSRISLLGSMPGLKPFWGYRAGGCHSGGGATSPRTFMKIRISTKPLSSNNDRAAGKIKYNIP